MIASLPEEYKTIIVAPLNWGLGHATRSMAVINELIDHGKEVIIASDGEALELLKQSYPQLRAEKLPSYNVTYKYRNLAGIVLSNMPNVASAIFNERRVACDLVKKYKADAIISDSRFGFGCPRIHSVIISHQLKLRAANPLLSFPINRINSFLLNRFDECWVPDFSDHRLSGQLSIGKNIRNVSFIGPLSTMVKQGQYADKIYDWAIILSGPEPARSRLESEIASQGERFGRKVLIIRGTNAKRKNRFMEGWEVIDLATRDQVRSAIIQSRKVLSRSGYSSIMDYYLLGIEAHLIPTPGQSEQEYLAEWLDGKYGFKKLRIKN